MKASQAANRIRAHIRAVGGNPKGKVAVKNTDYTTEIEVNLLWLDEAGREQVESMINSIDTENNFSWYIN